MNILPRLLVTCAVALCVFVPARAEDNVAAVLTKARARVGAEEALVKITAVRYSGTYEAGTGGSPSRLEVIFQTPHRMLQVITSSKGKDYTVLDDYLGWAMALDSKETVRQIGWLRAEAVRHLRANVWENLAFYRGLEGVGGRIEDGGTVILDGKPARKLTFWHDSQVRFARWFDPETGRLLQTETDDGALIREEGELTAGGLRFPKKITSISVGKAGTKTTSTIVFEKITLNEPMPPQAFAPPRPSGPASGAAIPPPTSPLGPLPKAPSASGTSNLTLPDLPPLPAPPK
jgi:outer membrane lipoprotein-sorting protein